MSRQSRGGFALVAALWVLVAAGAIALAFQAAARAERSAAANARSAARARWAARGSAAVAMRALDSLLARAGPLWPAPRTGDTLLPPVVVRLNGVRGEVLVLDARARQHLNHGTPAQLEALFRALGVAGSEATALADVLLDWRDPDARPRPRGAEAGTYAARRVAVRPANAPFDAVEDIAEVLGVTPSVYRRTAPYLTVAGDGRVNVNTAAAPVLRTIPGVDSAAAAAIVRRRRAAPYANVFELLASLPVPTQSQIEEQLGSFMERVAFAPRDVEIHAIARGEDPGRDARLWAVVRLGGGSARNVLRVVEH